MVSISYREDYNVVSISYREDCSVVSISYREDCNVLSISYREDCNVVSISYREDCNVVSISYREDCSVVSVSYREDCSVVSISYKEDCSVVSISYREDCSVVSISYRENCSVMCVVRTARFALLAVAGRRDGAGTGGETSCYLLTLTDTRSPGFTSLPRTHTHAHAHTERSLDTPGHLTASLLWAVRWSSACVERVLSSRLVCRIAFRELASSDPFIVRWRCVHLFRRA